MEEPLAVILKPGGRQQVFYRFIEAAPSQEWRTKHVEQYKSFLATLQTQGLNTPGAEHAGGKNTLIGKDGNLHIFDFESIEATPSAAKKLQLRKYWIPD